MRGSAPSAAPAWPTKLPRQCRRGVASSPLHVTPWSPRGAPATAVARRPRLTSTPMPHSPVLGGHAAAI